MTRRKNLHTARPPRLAIVRTPRSRPGLGLALGLALGSTLGLGACAGAGAGGARASRPAAAAAGAALPHARLPHAHTPADEAYQVRAADISDAVLRTTMGIASLAVGIGEDGREQTLPSYDQNGDAFTRAADLQLDLTHPISRFQIGTDPVVERSHSLVRRYPALARRGMFVKVALDPAARRTAWVRLTPEGDFPTSVELLDFGDTGTWRCAQLDLFFLSGDQPRKVLEKPAKGAAFTWLSPIAAGGRRQLDADIAPLNRQGNFISIAALRGVDDPREPIGWVELKDARGRLTLWFAPGPDC